MSVLVLVLVLCFLGGLLWMVKYLFPTINPTLYKIITVAIIIIAILITLSAFGVWEQVKGVRVPKI